MARDAAGFPPDLASAKAGGAEVGSQAPETGPDDGVHLD